MKNILNAITVLVRKNNFCLMNSRKNNNRANSMGDALELYVKNLFADTFDDSETVRLEKWQSVFSYSGNSSNPPDFMISGGDAVEVKKIESPDATLALNSSYPKQTLKSSSSLISKACREAEIWTEKDMLYTVGVVEGNRLKHLCMIYGRDYCASNDCYDRIRQKIKDGVESIPDVEFSQTKELGRINRVDPLGITYLRIRGMWHIENPWNVFSYIYKRNLQAEFNFMCIADLEKWQSFDNTGEFVELQKIYPALKIADVKIKNPDNPVKLKDVKLIRYEI